MEESHNFLPLPPNLRPHLTVGHLPLVDGELLPHAIDPLLLQLPVPLRVRPGAAGVRLVRAMNVGSALVT